jgi:hypothetical protein
MKRLRGQGVVVGRRRVMKLRKMWVILLVLGRQCSDSTASLVSVLPPLYSNVFWSVVPTLVEGSC